MELKVGDHVYHCRDKDGEIITTDGFNFFHGEELERISKFRKSDKASYEYNGEQTSSYVIGKYMTAGIFFYDISP